MSRTRIRFLDARFDEKNTIRQSRAQDAQLCAQNYGPRQLYADAEQNGGRSFVVHFNEWPFGEHLSVRYWRELFDPRKKLRHRIVLVCDQLWRLRWSTVASARALAFREMFGRLPKNKAELAALRHMRPRESICCVPSNIDNGSRKTNAVRHLGGAMVAAALVVD